MSQGRPLRLLDHAPIRGPRWFREEGDKLEERRSGGTGTKNGYKVGSPSAASETLEAATPVVV
jgi:hypothetical protein